MNSAITSANNASGLDVDTKIANALLDRPSTTKGDHDSANICDPSRFWTGTPQRTATMKTVKHASQTARGDIVVA